MKRQNRDQNPTAKQFEKFEKSKNPRAANKSMQGAPFEPWCPTSARCARRKRYTAMVAVMASALIAGIPKQSPVNRVKASFANAFATWRLALSAISQTVKTAMRLASV